MAKEVIWSLEAEEDLTNILEFYFYKVQARAYAIRLNEIFEQEIKIIKQFPEIGKTCNAQNVRA